MKLAGIHQVIRGITLSDFIAHSGGHLLGHHLQAVAELAREFSQPFPEASGSTRWAYLAGLWHDLGKYRPGFQRYVSQGDDPNAHIEGKVAGREKTHSAAGALWAILS
ncbi:MAG: CRISPR-associated endonuclease Cas3'' [Rhodoferax sp.]|nr:CRISPR-associated endonuclease Cas3'' [Rhodoferax sp.]